MNPEQILALLTVIANQQLVINELEAQRRALAEELQQLRANQTGDKSQSEPV